MSSISRTPSQSFGCLSRYLKKVFLTDGRDSFIYSLPIMATNQNRYKLTLDQFFKRGCEAYFTKKNFEVHTEKELITGAKRVDVVLRGKIEQIQKLDFKVFTHFSEHNLISFKSFKDRFTKEAVDECFIYFLFYLGIYKNTAREDNTTITMITSKTSKKVLSKYKDLITLNERGRVEMMYGLIHLVILNIEEIKLDGEDGLFLSNFREKAARELKKHKFSYNKKDKIIVDILTELFNERLLYFEGVKPMGAVADITKYVKPKLEEAEKRGIAEGMEKGMEKGIAEGMEKGKEKGKAEVALGMLNKGYSLSDISDLTGLSLAEIKKLERR